MSVYLLAFVMGDLHRRKTKTKNGTEVSVWGTVAQPADSFDFALGVAARSIEFFEDYFKVPYPLAKADHVALPDFASGAMENWGLITYREAALLLYPDQPSQSTKELIATVIAHETSHQWFGNLVTMRWWDDLWLNESFANMMEYLAVDSMFPEWHIWNTFISVEGLSALSRDSTPGVQAVKTDVSHPDEIGTLFDSSIVYAKGGRLLFMLKNYIGEEVFRRGLYNYFTKHAYGNTEGSDLWESLAETSGKNVAGFINPWLEKSGFPVVSVSKSKDSLDIDQRHFLTNPEKTDPSRRWPVPLFASLDTVPELLTAKSINIHLSKALDEVLVLNKEARGHYIVHYKDRPHRETLIELVRRKELTTADRLMLLSSSGMLARAGYGSFAGTLEFLSAYGQEDSEPVWDVIALTIGNAKRFIDYDEALEDDVKQLVRSLIPKQYSRLGWEERPTESAADKKLRGTILRLGAYGEEVSIIARAKQMFKQYQINDSSIPAELRSMVFGVWVREKMRGAFKYLVEIHHSTQNSDLRCDIMSALSVTRDTKEIDKLLDMIKDSKLIKPQDADRWLFYLLANRHSREKAWSWMVNNWDWIEKTYENEKSYDYFPRQAAAVSNTKEQQRKYVDFFMPKSKNPALQRNIHIGLEEITSRVVWLERDFKAVKAYFDSLARQA
jgi:aminopeptidase N